MKQFNTSVLNKLYILPAGSHKGDNGKLLIIGGSKLFHSASLWPLTVASRIVDMVYYSSVPVNNEIVREQKKEFRNGIVVPRGRMDDYIKEADCILIGPGLPRKEGLEIGDDDTGQLTSSLLRKYPEKKWVIDGGSLQTIQPEILPRASIITPHHKEFDTLKFKILNLKLKTELQKLKLEKQAEIFAKEFGCIVLLKGPIDIVTDGTKTVEIKGGNAGMTKGGTGDVLAGLVAALYCKNDAFNSAVIGSKVNKKAGDCLFKRIGYYFNASDLANEIPKIMNKFI